MTISLLSDRFYIYFFKRDPGFNTNIYFFNKYQINFKEKKFIFAGRVFKKKI